MSDRVTDIRSQTEPGDEAQSLSRKRAAAFSLGFSGRAREVQSCFQETVRVLFGHFTGRASKELGLWSTRLYVLDEHFEADNPLRSFYRLGVLLGQAYIQAQKQDRAREVTAREFQRVVRRIDPEVLERTEILGRIAGARGRRNELIDFVFAPFLPILDYRAPPVLPPNNEHVASQLGDDPDLVLLETPAAHRVRVYYYGSILAGLEGRPFQADEHGGGQQTHDFDAGSDERIPPPYRTKPMPYCQAAKLIGKDGSKKKAGEWLRKSVEDGTFACEHITRQTHVFDKRKFPEDVWPQITPESGK